MLSRKSERVRSDPTFLVLVQPLWQGIGVFEEAPIELHGKKPQAPEEL